MNERQELFDTIYNALNIANELNRIAPTLGLPLLSSIGEINKDGLDRPQQKSLKDVPYSGDQDEYAKRTTTPPISNPGIRRIIINP